MTTFVLVPCPPMRAKITRTTCVEMHESGLKEVCEECPLGPKRGAKMPWERKFTHTERRAMNAAISRWGRRPECEGGVDAVKRWR